MRKAKTLTIKNRHQFNNIFLPLCGLFILFMSLPLSAGSTGLSVNRLPSKLSQVWQKKTMDHKHLKLAKCQARSKNKNSNKSKKQVAWHSGKKKVPVSKKVSPPLALEAMHFQTKEIMPGIIYKRSTGGLRLNILDIDTVKAPVQIKPIIAAEGSMRLQTVKDHTFASHAIAAINANYFKNTGLPLGTLIIDGNWVSGPLYDRVALGISKSGFARIDRVGLGGILYTSNAEVPKLWVNNINAPRRSGCHTIAYSRSWGNAVHLQYDGCLVAVDADGKVSALAERDLAIPSGGMVLSDSKDSALAGLQLGDRTCLRWQITPGTWTDTSQAVSGGPMLIKDNKYCINLKAERFRKNWTSNKIRARTACGITARNHLLLITAEGNHTLYDLAHILHKLGAVDAMNLDGGGSTTMVIHDSTVNMESKSKERKVAVALGIFAIDKNGRFASNSVPSIFPSTIGSGLSESLVTWPGGDNKEPKESIPNLSSAMPAEKTLEIQPLAD